MSEYVVAFGILNRSRSVGMGLGPIPLSEVETYCRMFDVVDIEMFVRLITAMDVAYLEVRNRQDK